MISPAPIEPLKVEALATVSKQGGEGGDSRFSDLRGVQWRINLGILPSSAPIVQLRHVTADARRRYAGLRRRLLVDPHFPKDGSNSPDPVIDNPLSQDPDSMWGRFFRNAELEKMVDQDLSRLYPEHGSYFQTSACQSMLRRILLIWCLRHSEYGYGQGMHELLAPLLYVLHVDVQRLSEVRKLYEDHFSDKFDDMSFLDRGLVSKYKSPKWDTEIEDEGGIEGSAANLDELDSEIQTIVSLTDAYGAEGELGVLLSERFLEHDAYCMFDALMGGARGVVAMAEYFSPSPTIGSHTGLPPVIEASSALYHLLSVVDSSLHSHLIELGVEPQYFALRWLRVLFGREFSLDDLLVIWDEVFASENGKSSRAAEDEVSSYEVLRSPRGAFITAMAVSMLLHLRSSLLATENATSCLQRLLNFPENIDTGKLIQKAISLRALALDTSIFSPSPALIGALDRSKSVTVRGHSLSTGSISPKTPLNLVPDSYWEEKWRVLHKDQELPQGSTGKKTPSWKKGFTEKVKASLTRAESAPSRAKPGSRNRSTVRRSLLEDLSRQLGLDEDLGTIVCTKAAVGEDPSLGEAKLEARGSLEDRAKEHVFEKDPGSLVQETCMSGQTGSEENSVFSASSSPLSRPNDHENDSEKSSVASNLSIDENDMESSFEEPCEAIHNDPPLPVSDPIDNNTSQISVLSADTVGKQVAGLKDRKPLSGKFQWFWKFGRNANEGTSEKGGNMEASVSSSVANNQNNSPVLSMVADGCGTSPLDTGDKNVMGTLRNLGHSMLENIQVLESVFQQDRGQVENLSRSVLVGKSQVTALAALKELRKISNLLSEM